MTLVDHASDRAQKVLAIVDQEQLALSLKDQDAETVPAALRMTSRTTSGFDSMGT